MRYFLAILLAVAFTAPAFAQQKVRAPQAKKPAVTKAVKVTHQLNGSVNLVYFQDPAYRVWMYHSDSGTSCQIRVDTGDAAGFDQVVELANVCAKSAPLG